jgi:hypothetical protein
MQWVPTVIGGRNLRGQAIIWRLARAVQLSHCRTAIFLGESQRVSIPLYRLYKVISAVCVCQDMLTDEHGLHCQMRACGHLFLVHFKRCLAAMRYHEHGLIRTQSILPTNGWVRMADMLCRPSQLIRSCCAAPGHSEHYSNDYENSASHINHDKQNNLQQLCGKTFPGLSPRHCYHPYRSVHPRLLYPGIRIENCT